MKNLFKNNFLNSSSPIKLMNERYFKVRYTKPNNYTTNETDFSNIFYCDPANNREILLLNNEEEKSSKLMMIKCYENEELSKNKKRIFSKLYKVWELIKRSMIDIMGKNSVSEDKDSIISNVDVLNKILEGKQELFLNIIINLDYNNYRQFFFHSDKKTEIDLNIYLKLNIKISDLFQNNKKKLIHFNRIKDCDCQNIIIADQKCSVCNGKKFLQNLWIFGKNLICQKCEGLGKIRSEIKNCSKCLNKRYNTFKESLEVEVSNYANKSYLSYPGYGHTFKNNEGDLYIQMHYINDGEYELKDNSHIIKTIKVDFFKALLGFKIEVKTLKGIREISFPPGSRNNDIFTIVSGGLPNEDETFGNFIVKLDVETPKFKDEDQQILLQDLSKLENIDEINRLNNIKI